MINLHLDVNIKTLPREHAEKKIDDINVVANHFILINNLEEAEYCTGVALELSEEINYTKGIAGAKFNIGNIHYIKEEFVEAIEKYIESEKLYDIISDIHNGAVVCHKLALTYWGIGDYSAEIEFFFKALHMFRETERKAQESNTLNSIGNYYLETREFESALEYYRMSIELKKKTLDVRGIIMTLYNMALTYNNFASEKMSTIEQKSEQYKYYHVALKYYFAALDFNKKLEQDFFLETRIMQNIGLTYTNIERYTEAEEIFKKCLDYYSRINNETDKCDTLVYLATTYLLLKKINESEQVLAEALEIAERLNVKRLVAHCCREFARFYHQTKNFKMALLYYRKFVDHDFERSRTLVETNIRKLNIVHKVDVTKKQTQLLAEKNEQLKELNTELLSLNNDKNYFMNLAANDLKIPLQEISVLLNKTENSFFTDDKENQKKSLKEIVNLSSKMQTIISGLLEINELDSILN